MRADVSPTPAARGLVRSGRTSPGRHLVMLGFLTCISVMLAPALLHAQVQNDSRQGWSVLGQVFDMVRVDNTIYAAGSSNLAVAGADDEVERFLLLDPVTVFPGEAALEMEVPEDGAVNAMVSDGSTGWYVGGSFSRVGSTARSALAHLTATALDPTFAPTLNGAVFAMAKQGATLYVVGIFTAVNGQARGGGAAFDLTTGALLPWNPQLNVQQGVRVPNTVVVAGSTAYIGGTFTTASGTARQGFAAVNAATGALLGAPAPVLNAGGSVNVLLVSGNTLYVGGGFTSIDGTARTNLAALDATTGAVLPFQADASGAVRAFLLDGSSLYVGGGFGNIGGSGRTGLARVNPGTGAVDAWTMNVTGGAVTALLKAGATLYVGGAFTHVAGEQRVSGAAVTIATATVLPWSPGLAGGVNALGLAATGEIAVGGGFTHFAAVPRSGVAALDIVTNELLPFSITTNGNVRGIAVVGNTLYLAGQFNNVNGQFRSGFAAVDRLSGALLPWAPNAGGNLGGANGGRSVVVLGSTAYLGGYFTTLAGGAPRTGFAQVDATTGVATGVIADTTGGGINKLVLNGQTLYAGGTFTGIAGQARQYLAAFDVSSPTPTLQPLSIALASSGTTAVNSMKVVGSTIYLAGLFASVNGTSRNHAAAIAAADGTVTPFAPSLNGQAFDVDVLGSVAYLTGAFTTANGAFRPTLAAVDATTGANLPFAPNLPGVANRVIAMPEGIIQGSSAFGGAVRYFPRAGLAGLPGRPTAPTALVFGDGLFLTWAPPMVGGDVTGYRLEVGTGPGLANVATLPTPADEPSFFYPGALPVAQFYARVRAVSATGVGPASPEVAFATGVAACRGMGRGPSLLSTVTGSNVSLSWPTPPLFPGALTYTLSAGTISGSSNIGAFPLGATNTFAVAAPPGAYFLRLSASGPCGVAAPAAEMLLSVGGVVPLAAPVVSAQVNAGVVSISWSAVPGASGYALEAGFGPEHTFLQVPVAAPGLQANAPSGTYYVRVYAIGGPTGTSHASNETVVIVP